MGSYYGDVTLTASAASWAGRREMPEAHLPASATDGQADRWELVVGVTPGRDGGSATGARIRYHDAAGHAFTAIGRNGFALVPQEAQCAGMPTSVTPTS